FDAIDRIATEQSLDGKPAPWQTQFSGDPCTDLNHVAKELRKADKDGGVEQLWRGICRRWPIIARGAKGIQERAIKPEARAAVQQQNATAHKGAADTKTVWPPRTTGKQPVSRMLNSVSEWIKAGNVLPDLLGAGHREAPSIAPAKIDMGARIDHRPRHQR